MSMINFDPVNSCYASPYNEFVYLSDAGIPRPYWVMLISISGAKRNFGWKK